MSTKPANGDNQPAGGNGLANETHASHLSVPDLLAKPGLTDAEAGWLMGGVSGASVRNLHRVGALKGVKVAGKLCWRPRDIERFMAALEVDG